MVAMRGDDHQPRAMFSYVSAEERVPQDHPLRAIRTFVDEILRDMTREFDALYAQHGRPSIPPERLLRAQLLQLFYSIRSERLLMEQLDYNILFRWFVGREMDEPIWVPTVFTKNRERLLQHAVAHSFFQRVVARASDLMSDEHFTVDGTLIEAWASQSYLADCAVREIQRARRSKGPSRQPLAVKRVVDEITSLLFHDNVLADQCRQGGLHARGAGQAVTRPHVRRQQFAAALEHEGAQHGTLREREPLP